MSIRGRMVARARPPQSAGHEAWRPGPALRSRTRQRPCPLGLGVLAYEQAPRRTLSLRPAHHEVHVPTHKGREQQQRTSSHPCWEHLPRAPKTTVPAPSPVGSGPLSSDGLCAPRRGWSSAPSTAQTGGRWSERSWGEAGGQEAGCGPDRKRGLSPREASGGRGWGLGEEMGSQQRRWGPSRGPPAPHCHLSVSPGTCTGSGLQMGQRSRGPGTVPRSPCLQQQAEL